MSESEKYGATSLLAFVIPAMGISLEAFLGEEVHDLRESGKEKLAESLGRLLDAVRQISKDGTASSTSKAVLADYDEILTSYSNKKRNEAVERRNAALDPTLADTLIVWGGKEMLGSNKGSDRSRQMKKAESRAISLHLEGARACDDLANYVDLVRPMFAELTIAVGVESKSGQRGVG
jgi:hypothetical protein